MPEDNETPAAESAPTKASAMPPDELTQNFMALRRRMALLTGLVVADTAMLIVLLILAR